MEVPAPSGGTVQGITVKAGDKVSEGTVILTLGRRRRRGRCAGSAPAASAPAPARRQRPLRQRLRLLREPQHRTARPTGGLPAPGLADFGGVHASPSVRRLARELGDRPHQGDRHRREGPHHQGGREGLPRRRQPASAPPAAAFGRHGHPGDPGRRLLEVRPRGDEADGAHQAHLRPASAPLLAQHPARHPHRRGGHHRDRQVSQGARRQGQGRQEGLPRLAAALPDEGQRRRR